MSVQALNRFAVWTLYSAAFLFSLTYRAWRSRIHNGRYELKTGDKALELKTHLGRFTFHKDERYFEAVYVDNRTVKISFDDIRNIEILTEDVEAMWQEFLLEGFSIFIDTFGKYRDVVQRHSMVVVTKEFKRYPLFFMKQYQVKDFLNLGIVLQLDVLSMLHLYMPIEMRSQEIYGKFKDFLGREFRFDRE